MQAAQSLPGLTIPEASADSPILQLWLRVEYKNFKGSDHSKFY
jgi:hypothetical protein